MSFWINGWPRNAIYIYYYDDRFLGKLDLVEISIFPKSAIELCKRSGQLMHTLYKDIY